MSTLFFDLLMNSTCTWLPTGRETTSERTGRGIIWIAMRRAFLILAYLAASVAMAQDFSDIRVEKIAAGQKLVLAGRTLVE